jgi:hypothetical protein
MKECKTRNNKNKIKHKKGKTQDRMHITDKERNDLSEIKMEQKEKENYFKNYQTSLLSLRDNDE